MLQYAQSLPAMGALGGLWNHSATAKL
jgi:TIR domain